MLPSFRPRFTLKAMLFAVLVLSLGLSALSLATARARQQARAVRRLESLGVTVYYEFHHYTDQRLGGVISESRQPTNWTWARKAFGHDLFSDVYLVRFVDLHWYTSPGNSIDTFGPSEVPTDASRDAEKYISLLASLPNLNGLELESSNVTDAVISDLAKLQTLKYLNLSDTDISQSGFEELKRLLPNCSIAWHRRRTIQASSATNLAANAN